MNSLHSDREYHSSDRPTLPSIRDLFPDELSASPRVPLPTDPLSLAQLTVRDDFDDRPRTHDGRSTLRHPKYPQKRSQTTPPHRSLTSPQLLSFHYPLTPRPPSSQRVKSNSLSEIWSSPDVHRSGTDSYIGHLTPVDPRLHYAIGHQSSEKRSPPNRTTTHHHILANLPRQSFSEDNRSLHCLHPDSERKFRSPYMEATSRPTATISTTLGPARQQTDDEQTPVARSRPKAPLIVPPDHKQSVVKATGNGVSSGAKYECSYCGKGFNRPSSLKIHLNSHTGEKPFVCPVEGCGRSFSVLSNMRRHARVHTTSSQKDVEGSSDSDAQGRPSFSGSLTEMRDPPPPHHSATSERDMSFRSHHFRRDSSASSGSSRRSRTSSPDDDDDGRPEKRTRHGKATATITT